MKHKLIFPAIVLCCTLQIFSQETFPYNGVKPKDVTSVAITHATIFSDYQTKIEDATLVLEKGKVVAAGKDITIPSNAVVIDAKGKFIYPSFIDLDSDYGMPKVEARERQSGNKPQYESNRKGAFGWNDALRADINASSVFVSNEDAAKEMRALGFGTVLTHQHDGIARGTSALVCLGLDENIALIRADAAAHYSFNKGSSTQMYPTSLMGSIALLRQTYYDAQWYQSAGKNAERNLSLEAFNATQQLPQIFEAGDKWNVLRADIVGDEFNTQYIFRCNGNEYQRLDEIKATGGSLIVPLMFPDAYDVSDPYLTRMVSLEEMKHWELAPSNCAMLTKAQVQFSLTLSGLQDKSVFLKNLRKAIARGLTEQEALKALTHTPATLIHAENEIGALRPGLWANFFIASKNIFEEGAVIHENWVQGAQFIIEASDKINLAGNYNLQLPMHTYEVSVSGEPGKHKGEISLYSVKKNDDGTTVQDTTQYAINISQSGQLLTLTFDAKDEFYTGVVRLAGDVNVADNSWKGKGQAPGGLWFEWTCVKNNSIKTGEKKEEAKKDSTAAPVAEKFGDIIFPFVAFGWTEKPKQETVLIKNATVWTCEAEGKIENGQVLISGGKIISVGKTVDVSAFPNARIIDANGKHVTPGIIDEHSHIALESVNESGQASSAEVEEASVVWPEDIDIYRQLSGGVTASQLLHGSANPIGGQSAHIKMHWGGNAEDMLIDDATGFIKFALGENVKQSNWGDNATERFPQTRMGVEQIYYDHFIRAKEYGEEWRNYFKSISKKEKKGVQGALPNAPRRDLELETLYEILRKERFITCHSYVQSEINMLMHVADSMGFTINTFTHILEGYKVADKMKAHGAGGSSFSDWWAYKMEVKDAIPHNGALLWEQGITVAFNSDDAEMARRLNQEAAKAMKYGNVPEEEALKFVTLNPAKLLHLDHRMGSIKAGKDADIVIWSNYPLSIYAQAEQTFVDGICYYDIHKDLVMDKWISDERARLIQKMLAAKTGGEPTQPPKMKEKKHFHCDTEDQTSIGILNH